MVSGRVCMDRPLSRECPREEKKVGSNAQGVNTKLIIALGAKRFRRPHTGPQPQKATHTGWITQFVLTAFMLVDPAAKASRAVPRSSAFTTCQLWPHLRGLQGA